MTDDERKAPDEICRSCEQLERGAVVQTMYRNRPANTFSISPCHRLREIPRGSLRVCG